MPTTLWNRSFTVWLIATAQSQFGSAVAALALSFLVLHQTGSAGQMALTLACTLLPNLLMPLAGALVDRWNLKSPLVAADLIRGGLQLGVGAAALLWGEVPLLVINLVAVLTGLAGLFASPASSAAVPLLVPAPALARANALIGSVSRGAWLLGTLTGGWIVTHWSAPLAIIVDGLSFLVMAALMTLVSLPPRASAGTAGRPAGLFGEVRAGLGVMARSRVLMLAPVIALLLNAGLAPVTAALPKLFASNGGNAAGYGTFLVLESAGVMISGALVALLAGRLASRHLIAAGLGVTAAAYGVMWGCPQPAVLLPAAVVLGFGFGLINTPFQTLMQALVPQAFLGRVFSVLGMVSTVGMPVSLLLVAPLLDRVPLPFWFAVAAAAQGLGLLAWLWAIQTEGLVNTSAGQGAST
ncbi:MFS transporter [Deinococcus arenae]|uniref:MFS transporter n=1 Tax=Deinococcus arenae TaxID=1452751 RepID=A0A8H9GRP6_9DEIO|nr:MFS transporter [Deinococcus arenae]GGM52986.1 MFS transporter [Deinococcus arenae]